MTELMVKLAALMIALCAMTGQNNSDVNQLISYIKGPLNCSRMFAAIHVKKVQINQNIMPQMYPNP
jgi:hypothetical protein